MSVKRILLVSVFVSVILNFCGCRPYIIGADAGVYSGGRLYAVASRDLTSVYEATLKALGDLEIKVTQKAKDVFSARVVARGADDTMITVLIRPRPDNLTDLSIKVGPFGHKHRSRVIYEQIQQNLIVGGK